MNNVTGLETIKQYWGWFLILGILLIILGVATMVYAVTVTKVLMIFLGALLLVSGVVQCVLAFFAQKWSGFFLSLFLGLLSLIVGGWIIVDPQSAGIVLTLLIGIFLLLSGFARFILAFQVREHMQTYWFVLGGIVSVILGLLILFHWPVSGLWVIGLFLGIEVLLVGWTLTWVSIASRHTGEYPQQS